jgi:flavin reductase (DIM6/NTAB) family NADH-FMN oxidoreductase RutF
MDGKIDPKALFTFSYGLYIVSTVWEGKLNGQVADAVMQLTSDPIHITACLNKSNYTAELLEKSKKFSVSVFEQEVPLPFIGNFGFRSGREHDKFASCKYRVEENGVPVVTEYAVAVALADLVDVVDVHTHKLFIGKVTGAEVLAEGTPLTYANYHRLKNGKSPANAPSAIFNSIK